MAIAKVGSVFVATQTGTGNSSIALASTTLTKGNFGLFGFGVKSTIGSPSISGVTDGTNVYSLIGALAITFGANFGRIELWGGFIGSTVTASVTASWGGTDLGAAVGQGTQWSGVGGVTLAGATDQAPLIVTSSGTAIASGNTPSLTRYSNELLVAWNVVNGTPTISAQAFTPAGSAFTVPEAISQTTGTDNLAGQMSETLTGGPGVQSYAATLGGSAIWGLIIASFIPAGVGSWGRVPLP